MRGDLLKGHLDVMLLAVLREGPAHGYAIIQELKERSDGSLDLPEGTIYPALRRLEEAGLVTSEWLADSGRRRRVYTVTRKGASELGRRADEWRGFVETVDAVLGARAWGGRAPRSRAGRGAP